MLEWFSRLDDGTQRFVIGLIGLVGVLVTVLVTVFVKPVADYWLEKKKHRLVQEQKNVALFAEERLRVCKDLRAYLLELGGFLARVSWDPLVMSFLWGHQESAHLGEERVNQSLEDRQRLEALPNEITTFVRMNDLFLGKGIPNSWYFFDGALRRIRGAASVGQNRLAALGKTEPHFSELLAKVNAEMKLLFPGVSLSFPSLEELETSFKNGQLYADGLLALEAQQSAEADSEQASPGNTE